MKMNSQDNFKEDFFTMLLGGFIIALIAYFILSISLINEYLNNNILLKICISATLGLLFTFFGKSLKFFSKWFNFIINLFGS